MVGILVVQGFVKIIFTNSAIKAVDESESQKIHLGLRNNWSSDSEHSYVDVNWSTNLNITKEKYKLFRKSENNNWQDITPEIEIATETNDTSYEKIEPFNYFSKDLSVIDDVAPEVPNVEIENNDDEFELTISAKDKGKKYQWYVLAEENGKEIESSTEEIEVTSGIKGYIYTIDKSPTTSPAIQRDSAGNVTNIMLDESSPKINLPNNENNWIHIVAVDFENNVSETKHMEINESSFVKNKAIKFNSISNRATGGISFKVERTADKAKFVELAIDSTVIKDMKSIEIRLPSNVSISGYETMSLPTYWSKFQNSSVGNMQSFTFSMESTVNDKIMTNNSLTTITSFLNSLNFDIKNPTNQSGQIEIIFHKLAYASWIDPNGVSHYYAYVAPVGTTYLNWMLAYNAAKKMEYRGLKGYLATLTSYDEHYFVYNRIAKHSGWLGGARALLAQDGGKKSPIKINDVDTIPTTANSTYYDFNGSQWYWVDGPESGTVFFNRKTYAENTSVLPNPNGVYQGFNNPLNAAYGATYQEPNNAGTETILEFAQASSSKSTMLWNDLPITNTQYKSGFYVEFSEYGSQKETEEKTDISASADIPQKVVLNGYDQNGKAMPVASNRLFDQKLVIGGKVTVTPETFLMYDFMGLIDSNGNQLLPLEYSVSSSEQTGKLMYSLRKATINVRQVVVNSNTEVVIPTTGYAKLESADTNTPQAIGTDTYISMNSSADNSSSFIPNVIRYDINKPIYTLTATVPMNYKLIGYQTTVVEQPHTSSASSLVPVPIDVSKNLESWVTIYIEPVTNSPTQYNWDYKENNLSTIKVQ